MIPYIINRDFNEIDIDKAHESCVMICMYGDCSAKIWLHGWWGGVSDNGVDVPGPANKGISTEIMYLLGSHFYDYIMEINSLRNRHQNEKIVKELSQELQVI